MHLKEGKPRIILELEEKAENYVEAHATDIVFGIDSKPSSTRSPRSETRQCHNCEEMGHLRNYCPEPSSLRSARETFNTSASPQSSPRQRRQMQQSWLGSERQCSTCHGFGHLPHQCPNSLPPRGIRRNVNVATPQQPRSPGLAQQQSRSGLRCFLCDRTGHLARNYLIRPKVAVMIRDKSEREEPLEAKETKVKAAACQPAKPRSTTRTRSSPPVCSKHRQVKCSECVLATTPAHHCQALIAVCQDCGLHHPVVADACLLQSKAQQMPVAVGTVEGKPVSVLRDTGCSTVVVRRSLIPEGKLTGQNEDCILIDRTVRHVPVARILVRAPYVRGIVRAVCMKDYDYGKHSGCHGLPSSGLEQTIEAGEPSVKAIRDVTATTDDNQT